MRGISKIAIISGGMAAGGVERRIATLAHAFYEREIEVRIFCIGKSPERVAYDINPNIQIVGIHTGTRGFLIRKFTQLHHLRHMVKIYAPDSVIAFMDYINIQTIVACGRLGIPITVSLATNPNDCKNFIKIITRFLYRFADSVIFQTKEQQVFYNGSYKHGEIILNPANIPKTQAIVDKNRYNCIVSAGRLVYAKNFLHLIKAFQFIVGEFPDVELVIYGEGEQRNELEHAIVEFGLEEQASLAGNVPDIFERIANSRIFVMTSIYEGLPNALIEAMCLGTPCISTRFSGGGAESLIEDGVNGILVPLNDCEALANAMRRLLRDEDFSRRIGRNAKTLRERVDVDVIVEQWLNHLEALIKDKKNMPK